MQAVALPPAWKTGTHLVQARARYGLVKPVWPYFFRKLQFAVVVPVLIMEEGPGTLEHHDAIADDGSGAVGV
jgi:hypothetical protein